MVVTAVRNAGGAAAGGTGGVQWAAADGRGSLRSDGSGSPASDGSGSPASDGSGSPTSDGRGSSMLDGSGSTAADGRDLLPARGRGLLAAGRALLAAGRAVIGLRACRISLSPAGRPLTCQPPLAISTDTVPSAMCSASTCSGSSRSGISGAHHTLPDGTAGSNRSSVRSSRNGAAAAHACGEHEVGYPTGAEKSERSNPQNSSGSLPPNLSAASSIPPAICCACGTNPYRISPAAQIALSCGQTDPLW